MRAYSLQVATPFSAPFGMVMDERSYSAGSAYRYGFNGKEKDGETYEGSIAFEARILDTRIGRWLSIDPMWKCYPSISGYSFGKNNPVFHIDEAGKDVIGYVKWMINGWFKPSLRVLEKSETYKNFISLFVNTANKSENPYGAAKSGKYAKINLSFEIASNEKMNDLAKNDGSYEFDALTGLSIKNTPLPCFVSTRCNTSLSNNKITVTFVYR
jgi:RHS repeat-associated protein